MKVCKLCGEDCSTRPRVKDAQGSYYCKTCHAAALEQREQREARETDTASQQEADDAYSLLDEIVAESAAASMASDSSSQQDAIPCPSCGTDVPPAARTILRFGR